MGPVTFNKIVNHMFQIRNKIEVFDYPNYGDLPKSISYKLSSEAVDAMQDVLQYVELMPNSFKRKYQFRSAYYKRLLELGEPIHFFRTG